MVLLKKAKKKKHEKNLPGSIEHRHIVYPVDPGIDIRKFSEAARKANFTQV